MYSPGESRRHGESVLQGKFSNLLRWERIRRRERILVAALFYSLVVSLLLRPLQGLLPSWFAPVSSPPVVFIVGVLGSFLIWPWGRTDSVRSVFFLDKALRLQERALTAWELLGRRERRPAELLVLEEAAIRLETVEPRSLIKRQWSWHAYLVLPLLLLWLLVAWLGVDLGLSGIRGGAAAGVAQKLREFSERLKERAKAEELEHSARVAQELEQVAEKGLRGEIGLEALRENLSSMAERFGTQGPAAGQQSWHSLAKLPGKTLSELRAELREWKDSLLRPGTMGASALEGSELLERLSSFPLLEKEIGEYLSSLGKLNGEAIRDYLKRMERAVQTELERRSLQEVRGFLLQLLNEIEGKTAGESQQRASRVRPQGPLLDSGDMGRGSLPGDQPGSRTKKGQPSPFQARAMAHLRGLLGKGSSSGIAFRGEPREGESRLGEDEIVVRYRRQMEQELAAERIPQELRETIKRYFLSLGVSGERTRGEE